MRHIARHEGSEAHRARESTEVKLVPSRRDCYGVLLAITAVCSLAPFRGITFVLLAVAAVRLPNLPLGLRLLALSTSFCLVGIGLFTILNSA